MSQGAEPAGQYRWHVMTPLGEVIGPLNQQELALRIQQGQLDSSAQVRREDWDQWLPLNEVFPRSAADAEKEAANQAPSGANPYASPVVAAVVPSAEREPTELLTPGVLRPLAQTRPWVLLLAILGFIGTAFVGMAAVGLAGASFAGISTEMELLLVSGVYGVLGLVYFFFSWYLLQYALAIGRLLRHRQVMFLEQALQAQRSFWRLLGISVAAAMALYCIAMAILVGWGILEGGRTVIEVEPTQSP